MCMPAILNLKPLFKEVKMAKKQEDKKELLIYAGVSVPELILRKGKVYEKVPRLPEEFKFLRDWFVPLNGGI